MEGSSNDANRLFLNGDALYTHMLAFPTLCLHRAHTGRSWSQASLDLLHGSQAARLESMLALRYRIWVFEADDQEMSLLRPVASWLT